MPTDTGSNASLSNSAKLAMAESSHAGKPHEREFAAWLAVFRRIRNTKRKWIVGHRQPMAVSHQIGTITSTLDSVPTFAAMNGGAEGNQAEVPALGGTCHAWQIDSAYMLVVKSRFTWRLPLSASV